MRHRKISYHSAVMTPRTRSSIPTWRRWGAALSLFVLLSSGCARGKETVAANESLPSQSLPGNSAVVEVPKETTIMPNTNSSYTVLGTIEQIALEQVAKVPPPRYNVDLIIRPESITPKPEMMPRGASVFVGDSDESSYVEGVMRARLHNGKWVAELPDNVRALLKTRDRFNSERLSPPAYGVYKIGGRIRIRGESVEHMSVQEHAPL